MRRAEEDTHHQVEHGVHGEGGVAGEERLPGGGKKQTVTMVMQAATEASGGRTHRASWTLLSGP